MAVLDVDKNTFKSEVINHKGIVLVDFFAVWCGPCKIMGPIVDELANTVTDVKFVKVNVDENAELSTQYSVFSIPTFLIFKDGKVVSQFVGVLGKEAVEAELQKAKSS